MRMEEVTIRLDGKEYKVMVEELGSGKLRVLFDDKSYDVETQQEIKEEILKAEKKSEGKNIVRAPLHGIVVAVNVKPGSKVTEGMSLIKLVAMKMENDIIAEKSGKVIEVRVRKNQTVNKDDILVVID